MGITGLLPFLENATKTCHISEFRSGTVAIDSYCWLHKGANACAEQLARGEDTQVYVNYCLKYIKMLLKFDIHPIMVFDGKNLPAKADTEAKRREGRKKAKQRAAELLRLGKPDEARNYLKQCVDITPKMALNLIKECRKLNVDCIVAPYESDAQLAYFSLKGIADVIITEDSDLVLFGCKKVMYKMDLNGSGQLVEIDNVYKAMKLRPDKYTFDKFRYMCILSGCDYISSLHGIGLKKALKFITLTAETNPQLFLNKIPRYLNMKHLLVTDEYIEKFMIAEATFRHQTVFDPFLRKLKPLTDPEMTGTNPKYCINAGEIYDHDTALQVALGNLHPNSLEKLDNWCPTVMVGISRSIWSRSYKKSICRKEKKIQVAQQLKQTKNPFAFVSTKDVEQGQEEEDNQLEKELEFYKRSSTESTKVVLNISEESIEDTRQKENDEIEALRTSPVLTRNTVNPFIKTKKLSKFSLTTSSDNGILVKSRFFCSAKDEIRNNNIEKPLELTDIENPHIETCKTENIPIEKQAEIIDAENIPNNSIYEISLVESDDEESKDARSLTEVTNCEIDSKKTITTENRNYSQKPPSQTDNSNVKKTGPCRTIGLKRKPGQPSIINMFSKMKKTRLS